MELNDLNRVIARTLNACGRATGERRAWLRRSMRWLNEARNCLKEGHELAAQMCVHWIVSLGVV